MTDLRMAHTADLTAAELSAARDLLLAAFDGDFGEQDWDHALAVCTPRSGRTAR